MLLSAIFWLFVGPAALAALLSIKSARKYQDYVEAELLGEPDPDEPAYRPPASLILPVRGVDHDFTANIRSLGDQDYPDYELILVCRSADDPAVSAARMALGERLRLVIAGPPPQDGGGATGEKVHNLLRAVEAVRPESEVLVFADSDGQVPPGWLAKLVQPLGDPELGATTAFRWHFPEEGGFWPLLRSVWDATIAGTMRPDGKNFAWGGGMAIRRETFERLDIARYWRGTVSDDYRLAQAVHDAELPLRFVPGAMVATTGSATRDEFLAWATRQLVITKVYRKNLWLAGFVAHVVYCGAFVAGVVAMLLGEPLGLAAIILTQLPGMAKSGMRGYLGGLMFPERSNWFDRHGWAYFWLAPIATWVWLYAFIASARTRTIRWRDYTYELPAADRTILVAGPADS